MNEDEVARRIEEFVRNTFSVAPQDPRFGRDVDLFEGGYVDSVGLAEMLGFLEEEFCVEVPDTELGSEEFTTINGIARLVAPLAVA
jgi:acyl carrier protein